MNTVPQNPRRRRLILSNLHHAFPEKSAAWHRAIGRESCRRMIETGLLSLATPYLSAERLREIVAGTCGFGRQFGDFRAKFGQFCRIGGGHFLQLGREVGCFLGGLFVGAGLFAVAGSKEADSGDGDEIQSGTHGNPQVLDRVDNKLLVDPGQGRGQGYGYTTL